MELIPKQTIGAQSDNLHSISCENISVAKKKYNTACERLMRINEWSKTENNVLQTVFTLCDSEGKEVSRNPKINDHIKIDLMGPGSQNGDGYDWVQIEEIVIKKEESEKDDLEFTSIKVRPAKCPINNKTEVAHFFNSEATSTFIVSRMNTKVTAEIHGRNEEPNKKTAQVTDNLRNTLVAKIAAVKLSDVQWKNLCIAFLS